MPRPESGLICGSTVLIFTSDTPAVRAAVKANKALIAKYGDELAKIAEKNNVNLEFEASVCGGVPIIRSLKEGLIANKISKIHGIFNGTSNYILSSMDKENKNFDEVLINAQKFQMQ